jgi:hypothetical protein
MRPGGGLVTKSKLTECIRIFFLGVSLALCLGATLVFSVQPDFCAAVLVLPRWMWVFPGIVFALLGWTRGRRWFIGAVLLFWVFYTLLFVQEVRGSLRFRGRQGSGGNVSLRVVSLNCNGGNERAAAEVKQFRPELALFEESPSQFALRDLATNILGADAESYCSSDVSMIARGKVTPIFVANRESAPFIHARVEFSSGLTAEVFVVRLQPYNIRADLWSPQCWQNQCEIRKRQREQFKWIAREVDKVPGDVPVILGGDFNLPSGDHLFRILEPRIRDSFNESGRGWGDTLDNDFPVLRIDQIWCDSHFRAASTTAQKTADSDHRMVVCDLSWPSVEKK